MAQDDKLDEKRDINPQWAVELIGGVPSVVVSFQLDATSDFVRVSA